MLTLNDYSVQQIENLRDFTTVIFVIIDDIYQACVPDYIKFRKNVDYSVMHDSEIITLSLLGELLSKDSENYWIKFCKREFSDLFPNLVERSVFNKRRRKLLDVYNLILYNLSNMLGYSNDTIRITDSFPIEVCKFGRACFNKTFKAEASYGHCPSKKLTYFGFKCHMLTTLNGYITNIFITKADVDDREATPYLVDSYNNLTILADKGYISKILKEDLSENRNTNILPLKRKNSKVDYPKTIRRMIFKSRRRIETTISQLQGQLKIEETLAKTDEGLLVRILTKVIGYNISHFINVLLGRDNPAQIMHLITG